MKTGISRTFILIFSFIFTFVNTSNSQSEWLSFLIEKPIPKKAKLKTKKVDNYAVRAYLSKNKLVEGQVLTFLNITYDGKVSKDTILSGRYFIKDNIAYLAGLVNGGEDNYFSSKYSIYGIFKINNTEIGTGFTIAPDEAKKLSIEIVEVLQCNYSSEYRMYSKDYPVTLIKKTEDNNGLLKIELSDKIIENTINADELNKWLYIRYNDLNRYWYSKFTIPKDYITTSSLSKLLYKNGDVFIGRIETYKTDFYPSNGIYKFANGESVTSDNIKYNEFNGRVLETTEGEWAFTDGTTENGNWLKKYYVWKLPQGGWEYWEFGSEAIPDLSSVETMTEKHSLAIRLHNESQHKLRELKQEKKQKEFAKKQKKDNRPKQLLEKYGKKWADHILNGEFTIGMTVEMVEEIEWGDVYGDNNTLKMASSYVKSYSSSGKTNIEIWHLNPQIASQWRQTSISGISAYNVNAPNFPSLVFTNGILTEVLR